MAKSEKRFSCFEPMENAEEYFADWSASDHLFGTVFWKPELNLPLESSSSASTPVKQKAIREKIIQALGEIASLKKETCYVLQFWAHKVFDGRPYITNIDQPFLVGGIGNDVSVRLIYTYLNHKRSLNHRYYVGGEGEEGNEGVVRKEEIGPPGRVFRNGHPEFTPNLRSYLPREHPLCGIAVSCCFSAYMALPVFDVDDLDQKHCVGVLEYLTHNISFEESEFYALTKAANLLRSTHANINVPIHKNFGQDEADKEINQLIQVMMTSAQVVGANIWVSSGHCADSTSCMKLKLPCFAEPPFGFMKASNFHGVQMGKGVAGIALESQNKLCFCENISHFSIIDYPLAHFAQRARLHASFAVCLQSSHTGNDIYIIEYFLMYPLTGGLVYPKLLYGIIKVMENCLKSFKVASGRQLGEELVVKVIDFENCNFKFGQHEDTFPLKFEITRHEMKHQYLRNHQVQVTSDSAENMEEKEQDNAAANLEKGVAAMVSKREGNKIKCKILHYYPNPLFGKKLQDVLENLRVNKSTLKREFIDCGINNSAPSSKKNKMNPAAIFEAAANAGECAQGSSGGSRSPPPVMPL